MRIFDPADTLSASLTSGQIAMIKKVLAAHGEFYIQKSSAIDKTDLMAELCYQHAKCNLRTLLISRSDQVVDYVLRSVAKQAQIRVLGAGSTGRSGGKVPPFTAERVAGGWLRQTASFCQQDLLASQQEQAEAERIRLELDRLTKRQADLREACNAAIAGINRYAKQQQELSRAEAKLQSGCLKLSKNREQLTAEHTKILSELKFNPPAPAVSDKQLDSLLAAKRETEAVIAYNLTKRKEVTEQLRRLAEQTAWFEQKDRIKESVMDRETELQYLEPEKKRLIECLSLLTAHKPEETVVLSSNREAQIITISQYTQYLLEFAAVARRVQRQEYIPANPFLSQDIDLLLERIDTLKQRQIDLKFTAEEKINELHELTRVLLDTAQDYGWTTTLLKPDTQGVVVTYHSISCLREEANDLLWTPPPAILARLGFNTQWKKSLFALIIRAKAMEQLVTSPGSLREQTITEIDNLLLECRYLNQRVYEACYKHLMACGHALEQSYNQIQDELAASVTQLQGLDNKEQIPKEKTGSHAGSEEFDLEQSLAKVEYTLRQAQSELNGQESAIAARQRLLAAEDPAMETEQGRKRQQARLMSLARELDDTEMRLQDQNGKLAETRQRLPEVNELLTMSQGKLAELTGEEQAVAEKITASSENLADRVTCSAAAMVRMSITVEWIKRIKEISPAERQRLTQVYSNEANVIGMLLAGADLPKVTDCPFEWDVVITDEVHGETVPATLLPMCQGKKIILVE